MRAGQPTGVFTYQGQVANRALELLGKHLGMWSDKPAAAPGEAEVPFSERIKLYALEDAMRDAGNVTPFPRDGDGP